MNQVGQPKKKIVSKSKYVQVQSLRFGVGLAGFGMLLAAALCGMLTLGMFSALCGSIGASFRYGGWASWAITLLIGSGLALMVVGTTKMSKIGLAALDRAEQMEDVVPLTKANAPYLPAQESLVRASAEPPVAPETVLLRAATENTTTPPEQLVRSTNSPE